jgi:hypothetical protein
MDDATAGNEIQRRLTTKRDETWRKLGKEPPSFGVTRSGCTDICDAADFYYDRAFEAQAAGDTEGAALALELGDLWYLECLRCLSLKTPTPLPIPK